MTDHSDVSYKVPSRPPAPFVVSTPEPDAPDDEDEEVLLAAEPKVGWQMKQLKPKHKQIASLLAQGARNIDIAKMIGVTPEYVSMLTRQPLMQSYIAEMCQHTGLRLEALFDKSVDVIADTLRTGTESGRLKAARLQLEATKRIGRGEPLSNQGGGTEERLLKLAERLIFLQSGQRRLPGVFNEDGSEVQEAEFSAAGSRSAGPEPAQAVRDGYEEG
jgi:hypothetical protein